MAMAVGDRDENEPMMDMNTTPLIDVMLVLLIMFIITIPVQTHAVKIDLPVPSDNQNNVDPQKNKVMIDAAGTISWNGTAIDLAQLAQYLEETKALPVEPELQVQPDPFARYYIVDNVMAVIKRSGVGKLGFVGNEQYARVF
ncbi:MULTISPECIES: ExbD/TolR family protein [Sphingopyxis]|jgi:Biopolymer transport protein|uniref:Outer membrane transport energization protein ExbD n=1 Tax=Sphingopyxis flava TaxID=1507287 RepID=A0A1T5F217_9SPHN|nr:MULTISPECIES: biopolymer transporter ExbD [Sphingopyxis]ALC13776.1 biopolymer transporter ExbD [Sphingopyxis sp. 113P3]SKB90080.1 outer membrane transport energization protein ExbD [Sphingopyxis flava]